MVSLYNKAKFLMLMPGFIATGKCIYVIAFL